MKKRIYIDYRDIVKNGKVYCVYIARIQRSLLGFIWLDICVIADTDIEYVENRSAEILGYLEDEIEIKELADGED